MYFFPVSFYMLIDKAYGLITYDGISRSFFKLIEQT